MWQSAYSELVFYGYFLARIQKNRFNAGHQDISGEKEKAGEMIEETSAGIVLFRTEGSRKVFLLLHYPSGHWDFVKGKMEKGESTRQTAIREAKEETGIVDIEFVKDFEEWIKYKFQYQGKTVYKKVVFFLAEQRPSMSKFHMSIWIMCGQATTHR